MFSNDRDLESEILILSFKIAEHIYSLPNPALCRSIPLLHILCKEKSVTHIS